MTTSKIETLTRLFKDGCITLEELLELSQESAPPVHGPITWPNIFPSYPLWPLQQPYTCPYNGGFMCETVPYTLTGLVSTTYNLSVKK